MKSSRRIVLSKPSPKIAPFTLLSRALAAIVLTSTLGGCVTTKDGKQKFAPFEAAKRADQSIGDAEDQYLQ